MNGVPLVMSSIAFLALCEARRKGTPNFKGIGWKKNFDNYYGNDQSIELGYKHFGSTLAQNVNAIVDDPDDSDNETAIQGVVHINGSPHHLVAMRVWSGDPGDVDNLFPDVPYALRQLAFERKSIREGKLSKGEKAWLDLVRSDEMGVVRDPYNRLEDFYAAYGEETAFVNSFPIQGLPGEWITLIYPYGT